MTVQELYDALGQFLKYHPREGDRKVVVETQNGGIPTMHMELVTRAAPGFDWTHGYFLLWTENPVVAYKRVTKPLRDVARERLDFLKSAYERMRSSYIMKAREGEWMEGFREGFKFFGLAADTLGVPIKTPEEVR